MKCPLCPQERSSLAGLLEHMAHHATKVGLVADKKLRAPRENKRRG